MHTTIKRRIAYSPESSIAIGFAASQKRMAHKHPVTFTLSHPNVSQFDLQKELTEWRQSDPPQAPRQKDDESIEQQPDHNRSRAKENPDEQV